MERVLGLEPNSRLQHTIDSIQYEGWSRWEHDNEPDSTSKHADIVRVKLVQSLTLTNGMSSDLCSCGLRGGVAHTTCNLTRVRYCTVL